MTQQFRSRDTLFRLPAGDRYLLDGQYLYFCEFHAGYFALAFLQHSLGQQG